MTTFEALGLFYVIFATGIFTAALAIAAATAVYVGGVALWKRYQTGAIWEEKALLEQAELERMKAIGR